MSHTRPSASSPTTVGFVERHPRTASAIALAVLVVVGVSTGALTGTVLSRLIDAALTGVGGRP